MPEKQVPYKVDPKQTWLSISTVVLIAGGLVAFVWTAAEWKAAIQNNTRAISGLTEAVEGTWTEKDMRRWIGMFRLLNPEMRDKIPDAEK